MSPLVAVARLAQSDAAVGQTDMLVLHALAARADANTGRCWPSVATIAKDARLKNRATHTALKRLKAHGLIRIMPTRADGRQGSSSYTVDVEAIFRFADAAPRVREVQSGGQREVHASSPRLHEMQPVSVRDEQPGAGPDCTSGRSRLHVRPLQAAPGADKQVQEQDHQQARCESAREESAEVRSNPQIPHSRLPLPSSSVGVIADRARPDATPPLKLVATTARPETAKTNEHGPIIAAYRSAYSERYGETPSTSDRTGRVAKDLLKAVGGDVAKAIEVVRNGVMNFNERELHHVLTNVNKYRVPSRQRGATGRGSQHGLAVEVETFGP